jgi:ferritin-like metal-binding protein YciE
MSTAQSSLKEKLVDYTQDAQAMERNVLQMLDSMIANTDDAETLEMLREHRDETVQHEERLSKRLEAMGEGTSGRKQAQTMLGGLVKGAIDSVRGDKPGKNARDGFETAGVARLNRADEEAMAERIAASWDHVLDLTLAAE